MSERDLEEEYFAKEDREKLAKLKAKQEAEAAAKARIARKEAHFNKCGKCGADMDTHPFRGVEIEICPECGAVLLDNGELEKLAGTDEGGMLSKMLSIFNRED
jgi:hypothetical protein